MSNLFPILRYTVFGLFIACNAIICSVSVWNLSLAQAAGIAVPVDPYLIFVGLSGLLFIFTLIFVQLARRQAVTIWVECFWTSTFLVMETIGAAVVTATAPVAMCSGRTIKRYNGSCISTQLVLGLTWVITVVLFAYVAVLAAIVLTHGRRDRSIWTCSISNLPSAFFHPFKLASVPNTPILPRFVGEKPASIVAPKPQRPIPDLSQSYRRGLSPDYEIEHFQPPPPPPVAVVQPNLHSFTAPSFYNEAVRATMLQQPRADPQPSLLLTTAPSPPPLKDWPRADVMSKPLSRQTSQARTHNPQLSLPSPTQGVSRPAGPRRKRTSSGDMLTRPPPLDLSNISSFNRT